MTSALHFRDHHQPGNQRRCGLENGHGPKLSDPFAAQRPQRLRIWMRDFDQYILSISDILNMDLGALPPLTVVIFAREKDYTPYKLQRPDGTTANVAGQFVGDRPGA